MQPHGSSLLPLPWSSSSVLVVNSLGTCLNCSACSPCPEQVQLLWKFGSWGAQLLPVDRHSPKQLIPTSVKVLFLLFQRNPYHPSFCRGRHKGAVMLTQPEAAVEPSCLNRCQGCLLMAFPARLSPISTQSRGMRALLMQPEMFSLSFVCS